MFRLKRMEIKKRQHTSRMEKQMWAFDKNMFEFNIASELGYYIYTYMRGGRVYLPKDLLDTIPKGKRSKS